MNTPVTVIFIKNKYLETFITVLEIKCKKRARNLLVIRFQLITLNQYYVL